MLLLTGCRCSEPVTAVTPAELTATPMRLVLGPIYVGQEAHGPVEVANVGGAPTDVDVAIDSPFSTSVERLQLVRGESREVVVTFAPVAAGQVSTRLKVGALDVEVIGEALEIPMCTASSVCTDARFEVSAAQCLESPKEDGSTCETSCVAGGCAGGTCVGQLKGCDDRDACTIDACSEVDGCSHSPRTCPAATLPCYVAKCDPLTGCGVEPVVDGTLCGPDDCAAVDVDVCIVGRCVRRTRNATGRCVNRWVSMNIPTRSGAAMAYDAARQRLVLFGGSSGTELRFDTWEWNGTVWEERLPNTSPSAREGHAMAWDPVRQRVVLFGGRTWAASNALLSDFWEWDGTTWVERVSATAPPPRTEHRMAWDVVRHRLVVFGGTTGRQIAPGVLERFSDTWEWDGTSWSERTPSSGPSGRAGFAMGYDAVRQRVFLFGGAGPTNTVGLDDTWEWDGTSWLQRQPALSPQALPGIQLAWDARRERLVLFGGSATDGSTWEWDGTNWSLLSPTSTPPVRRGYAMAWDGVRERVVLFSGLANTNRLSDTWEWDGTNWTRAAEVALPPPQRDGAMAYDAARGRLVLFGGTVVVSETWEWNIDWNRRSPSLAPSPRADHAMAYDSARHRVVLFGGSDGNFFNDTWEWDGASWFERRPQNSPPECAGHSMAYDAARQRVVLFCSYGTWEWDGTNWAQMATTNSLSAYRDNAMAYDPVRQRVLLFGGVGATGTSGQLLEWDGTTWTERITSGGPSPRQNHAMAWDTSRQRLVLFGGDYPGLQDTWEWDGAQWTQRMPVTSPPRSSGHSMAFHASLNRVVLVTGGDTWIFLP